MRLGLVTIALAALAAGCSGGDPPTKTTPGTLTGTTAALDADGDGFGYASDCDDRDPSVHPGADDPPYDGLDADCGGDSDYDVDLDGYDDPSGGGDDCDDADPAVFPGAAEVCNGVDDDCDGAVDPAGADGSAYWYADDDEDGQGDPDDATVACEAPTGTVSNRDDCDDADPNTWLGAPDVLCDGHDNDCIDLSYEAGGVTLDGVPVVDLASAASAAGPGSTIALCEGVYPASQVAIGPGVTLSGAGATLTRVEAGGAGPVLSVRAGATVTLEGLTLTGGGGRPEGADTLGGGLYAEPVADIVGTDVRIVDNTASLGAGVYLGDGAHLTLTSSAIEDNHAAGGIVSSGGGVWGGDDVALTLADTAVAFNDADTCGGVELGANGAIDGSGSSAVSDNAATSLSGGGVCLLEGGSLTDLEIARNDAPNIAGGVHGTDVRMTGVELLANTSGLSGGAGALFGLCELVDSTVSDNIADIDGGGFEIVFDTGWLIATNSVFSGNEASFFAAYGGAVLVDRANLQSIDTDWGAAVDNLPSDVSLLFSNVTADYAGVASFVCVDAADGTGSCQ